MIFLVLLVLLLARNPAIVVSESYISAFIEHFRNQEAPFVSIHYTLIAFLSGMICIANFKSCKQQHDPGSLVLRK